MELVVVILLVFLEYQLELGIPVGVVRLLAAVLIVQDFISHVSPLHALGIFIQMGLEEGIALLIPVLVRVLLAKER